MMTRTAFISAALAALILACAQAALSADAAKPLTVAKFLEKQGLRETEAFGKLLADASLEIKSRNYFKAAELLVKARTGFPEHPVPCMLLGFTFGCMGHLEQGALYVRKGISLFPGIRDSDFTFTTFQPDREELAWLVETLVKKSEAAGAGQAERATAAFMTGAVLFFSGSKPESKKWFEAVRPPAPENPAAAHMLGAFQPQPAEQPKAAEKDYLEEGNRYFLGGMYREAAFAFGFAFIDNPGNVVACFELAHSLFALAEYHKAARMISLGLSRYPAWADVSMDRREFYSKELKADFDAKLAELKGRCEKEPGDPALWFLLGYNLHFSSGPESARAAFDKASAAGWAAEAGLFLKSGGGPPKNPGDGREPGPRQGGEKPGEDDSDTSKLETWLGHLSEARRFFSSGGYDRAGAEYRKALELRPEASAVRFDLARVLFASGRFDDAAAEVRSALAATPEEERHRIMWKNAYDDPAAFDAHLASLASALDDPARNKADLCFLYAFSLFYSGEFTKAAVEFEKVFVRNPQDALAIYYFKLIDKLLKKK